MHSRHLLVCACLLPAACTGPATVLHNPKADRVFVDGREVPITEQGQQLPFRYYGTSRWDAEPGDVDQLPDWSRQPASAPFDLPAPVSEWLFPLDFPLELLHRAWVGRGDFEVAIDLPPTPPELVVPAEVPPPGLGALVQRGNDARIQR